MMELSPDKYIKELSRSPRPLYILLGASEYLIEKDGIEPLLETLSPPDTRDFNLEILDGADQNAERIVNAAETFPVMAQRRVVVVKRAHLMSPQGWKVLAGLFENPPKSATVAFAFAGAKKELPKPLLKAAREAALVTFGSLKGRSAARWLKERAQQRGKRLTQEAAELILLLVGERPSLMAEELEKCLMFAGEKESVGAQEVEAVVGDVRLHDVFELTRLVAQRDGAGAVDVLRRLVMAGEEPTAMLGLLTWQLRMIWLAREHLDNRVTREELGSLIRPSWKVKEYLRQAEGFTLEELAEGFGTLLCAEMALKSTTIPPAQVLESAVLRLCRSAS